MESIRILIVEHDIYDLDLLLHVLNKNALNYIHRTVETRKKYEEELINFKPQIILADYNLPAFDGLSAFNIKQDICPEIPFIIVSGAIGEEKAVELIKKGVTDYVPKENMYQVIPKVQRALKEARDREQKCIAENALKESQEQLQRIMDQSLDMICTIDLDGRFVEVSAASSQVLGYAPEELRSRSAWELIHPEDLEKTAELAGVRTLHFENRYIRKNGDIVPLFWTVRWDENEKLAYCVARDASAIKKAETELAEYNEQIKNILESITDGFVSLNRQWDVIYWNRAAEYILGTKRENIIGKNVWDVFHEAISLKFYTEYHRVMNDRVSSAFEEYFPQIKAWIQVIAYPSKDGISLFFKDITELKRVASINNLQKEVLELYTRQGSQIEDTISLLLDGIQQIHPELLCSVLKRADDKLLYWVHSQSLKSFNGAKKYLPVGKNGGICGMAALLKKKIAITDISAEPLFKNYHEAAAANNLKAAVCYPISDTNEQILGIFTIYLSSARALTSSEEASLERARYVLQHVIENHVNEIVLKESEEKYRDLFHLSPLPMWVYDSDTYRFLNVNEAAIRHYGYSLKEFFNMTIRDIRPKDAWNELETAVEASKKNHSFSQGTFDHLKKNGELIKVHIQSNLIAFGSQKARIVLANDITEKLKIETSLEISERRFKALVQGGSELINIIDKEGNIKYASPASASIMGSEPNQLIGKNVFEFIQEDDKAKLTESFSLLNRTKRVQSSAFRLKCEDHQYRWLQTVATNLLNDPAINGIVLNSRDITESVNYTKSIEEQNCILREIAWIQSHVVRAPLVRIMGLIDLIGNYPNDKESLAVLLDHLLTSAYELDDVIRTIVKKSEMAEIFQIEPVN